MRLHGPDEPVYTIGVAARLLGVNPQTLRQIEREGLLEPARTEANMRLYSQNDLMLLQRICFLVREEGVNLAGVKMILQIESKHGTATIRYREVTQRVSRGARPDEGNGNS